MTRGKRQANFVLPMVGDGGGQWRQTAVLLGKEAGDLFPALGFGLLVKGLKLQQPLLGHPLGIGAGLIEAGFQILIQHQSTTQG